MTNKHRKSFVKLCQPEPIARISSSEFERRKELAFHIGTEIKKLQEILAGATRRKMKIVSKLDFFSKELSDLLLKTPKLCKNCQELISLAHTASWEILRYANSQGKKFLRDTGFDPEH